MTANEPTMYIGKMCKKLTIIGKSTDSNTEPWLKPHAKSVSAS